MGEFDPERLLQTLVRNGVHFVVIGGFAGTMHGSPYVTFDLDVTPERSGQNLERLALALKDLDAKIRVEGVTDGLPFDASAEFLGRVELLNLTTEAGELDIAFAPSGLSGYEELAEDALQIEVRGTSFAVASLRDVIRSKTAADRPKDRLALPALRALLARQDADPPDAHE